MQYHQVIQFSLRDGALHLLLECFEGDHELDAYTFQRSKGEDKWSEAAELYLASTSVKNLVKRLMI